MKNYYNYILYSFFIIGISYFGILLYKEYFKIAFFYLNSFFNINKTKNEINSNNSMERKKINSLKNKFNIKSTEITNKLNKFIINKPTYINLNIDDLNYDTTILNSNLINDKINLVPNNLSKNIIKTYIYNKQNFYKLFYDNDICKISNIKTFFKLYKNTNKKIKNKYNFLLKFYSNNYNYQYIYIKDNNLIKIINNNEYDDICDLLNKNNVFIIKDNKNNNHYLCYGESINCDLYIEELNTLFTKNNDIDKNLILLNKFDKVNIIFWISTIIM